MGEILITLMYVETNSKIIFFFGFFILLSFFFFLCNKTSTMCVKVCPRRQVLQEICISMFITYYKYCIFVIIAYFIFLFVFYKMKK